jgi:membrane fusion protein, multidrug efflux system
MDRPRNRLWEVLSRRRILGQSRFCGRNHGLLTFAPCGHDSVAFRVFWWTMRRSLTFLFVLVLFVALIGGLSYFQFTIKPAMIHGFIAKAAPPPATVAAATARQESWTTELPAIGTFRAIAGINIAPQVAGVITAIHAQSGEDVAQGELLVNLDDSVEQADLQSDLAALKNDDVAYQRQALLIRNGNTAKAQVDQALAARDQASAAVQRERVLIAQKALTAPFAGRLGLRNVDLGQYISAGTSIVTLQELNPIYVDFPIPEQSFGLLAIGEPVNVGVDAYPGRVFAGKIASIDARISADTRNVMVRAQLPNTNLLLRPGMFANVTVVAGAPHEVTTLPTTAVAYSLYGNSVFVLKPAPGAPGSAQAASPQDETYQVETRPVTLGDVREDQVAVLSGVAPGERVISEGQVKLIPGALVKIDNSEALPPRLTPRPKE